MTSWEYARLLVDRGDISVSYSHHEPERRTWPRVITALHDLGDEGWELIAATNRDGNEILHFKRPRHT